MPVYSYVARGIDGGKQQGSISATDKTEAQNELRRRRLIPTSLTEVKKEKKKYKGLFGPPKPRAKTKEIAVWTRQLATMISAGIPLLECLEILQEQATNPGFHLAMDKIIEMVRGGSDFSSALGQYPKIYSNIYVNMVKAGEASGQLDAILTRLAEYMESSEALKREIKSAMTYPVISLFLIVGITIGLLVLVVPQFKSIFDQMGLKELPPVTALLLSISDTVKKNVVIFIGAVVCLVIAFNVYKKTKRGEKNIHWLMFHIPVFGNLFRKVAISRFSRTFATLLQSGVPIVGALEIVAGTSGNRLIQDAVLKAKDEVTKGNPLGEPLAETKVFPPMVTRMISIGEKSGALEQLLGKVSDFYDQEVKTTVEALTSLIEPLLIATMGIMVGGIVIAIFMPILKIQEALSKK
jgi:type IV pilus assembly protein PilC